MGIKVIKPLTTGILLRPYHRLFNRIGVTGIIFFDLRTPRILLPETEMWPLLKEELGSTVPFDIGIPKDRGELLLLARCFTGGIPKEHQTAQIRVGSVTKQLFISGDRTWRRQRAFLQISSPEPFTEMPISYGLAFGGKGFAPNPSGKGYADPVQDQTPLPNIENPRQTITSPSDRPSPEGFGPIEQIWPQRFSRLGTYQNEELEKDAMPLLPENTDWTFFNQAPQDQWIGGNFWEGGEDYQLENLHPHIPSLVGRIPSYRLRSFLTIHQKETEPFVEVPLSPETLWLIPHRERGILIYRGFAPILTDDASEVESVLLAAEDISQHRTVEHYRTVRDKRMKKGKSGGSGRFSDLPLLPDSLSDNPLANQSNPQYHLEKHLPMALEKYQSRMNKRFDKIEKDLENQKQRILASSPPVPEGSDNRLATINKLQEKVLQARQASDKSVEDFRQKVHSKEMMEQTEEEELSLSKKMQSSFQKKISEAGDQLARSQSYSPPDVEDSPLSEQSKEKIRNARVPAPDISSQLSFQAPSYKSESPLSDTFEAYVDKVLLQSLPPEFPREKIDLLSPPFPDLKKKWESTKSKLDQMNTRSDRQNGLVRSAHYFAPPPPNPAEALRKREKVLSSLKMPGQFQQWDLRGADLSGLSLEGADLSKADLMGSNLSGTNLCGANLSGSLLTHSCLRQTNLVHADLSGANMGFVSLDGADLSEVDARKTIFFGAVLTNVNLTNARLEGSDWMNASLKDVDARGIHAPKIRFYLFDIPTLKDFLPEKGTNFQTEMPSRSTMINVNFSGAFLEGALFMKNDLRNVVFDRANLTKASFLECTGPNTSFVRATMIQSRFIRSGDFSQCTFLAADLSQSNLRNGFFAHSDFTESILEKTDFSESDLRHTLFRKARAISARFTKSNLEMADATKGDFRKALFLKTDIRSASFLSASLYEATLIGAQKNQETVFDGVLTGKSTLQRTVS